jgi:hypothetical protein
LDQARGLDEVVRRARRRHAGNLIVTQVMNAACAGMGGVILLLLLGTQILDWRWLAGLCVLTFVLSIHWTRKRLPSAYRIAQGVDRNLGLHDTLSTAFFYNRMASGRKVSEGMRAAQLAAAERLCRKVDLGRAVPLAAPRSLYTMAALGVVASGLFGLRYLVSHTLDLRPPLAAIVLDAFRSPAQHAAAVKRTERQRFRELLRQYGLSVEEAAEENAGGQDGVSSTTLQRTAAGDARGEMPRPLEVKVRQTNSGAPDGNEEDGAGERLTSDDSESPEGEPSGAASKHASNSPKESNSLLDKFRDAMANLLSRLKIQPKGGDSQQMASASQGRQDLGQGRQSPGQKGSPGPGRQLSDGLSSGAAQADEQSEGIEKASDGAGRRGEKESDLQAAKEGRSGIGKEDGSKELREAEQLAAMGKISEIFGKRSQNLTGEVMVEVPAAKQQKLRTAYSQQEAMHGEAGGEIHRDEIPLAYQRYVEQYFEQIHKAAPADLPEARRARKPGLVRGGANGAR